MIPDTFNLVNVTDTCALWHLVGADTLFRAARQVKVDFIITPTVFYECFVKTRGGSVTAERQALRTKLQGHLDNEQIAHIGVSIEDLQDTVDIAKRSTLDKRLGQGELSCAALARRLGHPAVLTDNKRDFLAIRNLVNDRLQKTPQLLGWLYVKGHISDSDVDDIVCEHKASSGQMADIYKQAYEQACEKRLVAQMGSSPTGDNQ